MKANLREEREETAIISSTIKTPPLSLSLLASPPHYNRLNLLSLL